MDNICYIEGCRCRGEDWIKGYFAFRDYGYEGKCPVTESPTHLFWGDKSYNLPEECYESSRNISSFYSSSTIHCEGKERISLPVPVSFFGMGCYISARWRSYDKEDELWTTNTTYRCEAA